MKIKILISIFFIIFIIAKGMDTIDIMETIVPKTSENNNKRENILITSRLLLNQVSPLIYLSGALTILTSSFMYNYLKKSDELKYIIPISIFTGANTGGGVLILLKLIENKKKNCELQKEKEKLKKEKISNIKKIEDLKQLNEKNEAGIKKIEELNQKNQEEKEKLKKELALLKKEIEKLNQEHQEEVAILKKEINANEIKIESLKESNKEHEKNIEELKNHLANIIAPDEEKAAFYKNYADIEKENNELKQANDSLQKKINKYKKKLQALQQECQTFEKEISYKSLLQIAK